MKALTVQQPWAWAICRAGKSVENRAWGTKHRGLMAVHAGTGWSQNGDDMLAEITDRAVPARADLPAGAIVAVADLTDIHRSAGCCHQWGFGGGQHWVLANVRPLAEPIPCKGSLSLWTVPDDVAAAVAAQTNGAVTR